jgi:hypothetical protein
VAAAVLPELRQHPSPNFSSRHGAVPFLIVLHRPVGSFESAERALTDDSRPPAERVSAHVLLGTGHRAVQLVPWDVKAWTCASFNSLSYNLEVGDEAWDGRAPELLAEAARAVAFLSRRTGIPATWTRAPHDQPGVTRHFDLGKAGGGHTDPTTNMMVWRFFMQLVETEHRHGGFRPTWGVGELVRIDT